MDTSHVCPDCGFESPLAWRACARCLRPLGHRARKTSITSIASLDKTVVTGTILEEPYFQGDAEGEGEIPLIGQPDAAQAIQAGVERAFSLGAPTLVALEGTRGSGKTRLLMFASEIAAGLDETARIVYGSCREGDGGYAPFSRLLLDRFGVRPSSSPRTVRAQMASAVGESLATKEAVEIAATTHLLGHIAGVPFPESPFLMPLEKNPSELHKRACNAMRQLFEGDATQRPTLLLLDNLQWAEDPAWDILKELCNVHAHLAIVITGDDAVAERASALSPAGGVAVGPIAPLSDVHISTTLQILLPGLVDPPEPLVSAIAHRSEGNPAAVRELTFALWDAGLFQEGNGRIEVDLALLEEDSQLPVSMEDAIQARIQRLNPLELATLERAAIVGEVFWDGAVLGQMRSDRPAPPSDAEPLAIWAEDDDEAALAFTLQTLEERGFIIALDQSDLPGAREYQFVNDSRVTVYAMIDEATREHRHAAVARWLGLVGQHEREGVAHRIAPHLEKAGQLARAGRAYLEAAIYDRARMRTRQALLGVERALTHIPQDDIVRRIDALHMHGSLLHTLGRYGDAKESFSKMLRLAWGIGSRGKGGAAMNRLARISRAQGEIEEANALLGRALELFRGAGDLRGVASTLDDLAEIAALRGELELARQQAREALDIRQAHADIRGEAVSLNTLARIELRFGDLAQVEQLLNAALAKYAEIDDAEGAVQVHNALGVLAYEHGDRPAAVRQWRQALDHAREIADRRTECFLLNNVGEARTVDGAFDEADIALTRAMELASEGGDRRALAEVQRNLSILALKRGDSDAQQKAEEAMRLAQAYGAPEAIAHAHRAVGLQRAQTLFGSDAQRDAVTEFQASIELFVQLGNHLEAARSAVLLARHLIEQGQAHAAAEHLHNAKNVFLSLHLAEEAAEVERVLASLNS